MPKKLTMEEKRELIKEKYGDKVSLIDEENKNTKDKTTLFKCNVCGENFNRDFYSVYHSGYWCPQCSGRRHFRSAKEVSAILFDLYGDKIYMDEDTFVNTITPPTVHCRDCGYTWTPNLMALFRGEGCGCPACEHKVPVSKEEAHKRVLEESDGSIDFYDETFVNVSTNALMFCKECGYEWWTRPSDIYNKHRGCGRCAGIAKHTYDEILDIVFKAHGGKIKVLTPKEEYKNTEQKLEVYCNECGYVWESSVHNLRNHGCPSCSGSLKIDVYEAAEEAQKLHDNSLLFYNLDACKSVNDYVTVECLKDGNVWTTKLKNLRAGHGCKVCCRSKLEAPIYKLLKQKNCDFNFDKPLKGCKSNNSTNELRPDFVFKKFPLVIELDGQQHFNPIRDKERFIRVQEHDIIKNDYCKNNGLCLIRVTSSPTHEWGTERHITLYALFTLIYQGISNDGEVDMSFFWPFDFNRD